MLFSVGFCNANMSKTSVLKVTFSSLLSSMYLKWSAKRLRLYSFQKWRLIRYYIDIRICSFQLNLGNNHVKEETISFENEISEIQSSTLTVNVTRSVNYSCWAYNNPLQKPKSDFRNFVIRIKEEEGELIDGHISF